MSTALSLIIGISSLLVIYWILIGQRKHNEMFNPKKTYKLKAVLFDFDGVIVDTFKAWFKVVNAVRKNHKLPALTEQEFRKKAWGPGPEHDAKVLFNNIDVAQLKKEYAQEFDKHIGKVKLNKDAKQVITAARKKGYQVGLATNNFRTQTKKILKNHKLASLFDAVVTFDDVAKPKPNPEPLEKLAKKLNVKPQECLFVGDAKVDVVAGRAAGCTVVGFNVKADLTIPHLKSLEQLF